jgi:hypothetical protein
MSAAAGAGAAVAAAAIAQAIKASGVLVRVEPDEFIKIAGRTKAPLVIAAKGGFFRTYYTYLTSYKGFAFYARSKVPLQLPRDTELVGARGIWIPG